MIIKWANLYEPQSRWYGNTGVIDVMQRSRFLVAVIPLNWIIGIAVKAYWFIVRGPRGSRWREELLKEIGREYRRGYDLGYKHATDQSLLVIEEAKRIADLEGYDRATKIAIGVFINRLSDTARANAT